MKKLLSIILTLAALGSQAVFADAKNYEYILPMEYTQINRLQNGCIAYDKQGKCAIYDLNGKKISDDYDSIGAFYNDRVAAAQKNGEYYIINPYGTVLGIFDKKIMNVGDFVLVNLTESNEDGRFTVSDGENYGVAKYTGFVSPWAKDAVEDAKRLNITKADGSYNYTANITREEFCELVFNYFENYYDEAVSIGVIKPPFTDTENEHIAVLNALDIIKGKSETEFALNDFLTREEAATLLCRLIKKVYPNAAATEMYFDFADGGEISDWAMSSVQTVCNMGIMNGVGDNKFAPQELYTTEQAIATLVRCHGTTQ